MMALVHMASWKVMTFVGGFSLLFVFFRAFFDLLSFQ